MLPGGCGRLQSNLSTVDSRVTTIYSWLGVYKALSRAPSSRDPHALASRSSGVDSAGRKPRTLSTVMLSEVTREARAGQQYPSLRPERYHLGSSAQRSHQHLAFSTCQPNPCGSRHGRTLTPEPEGVPSVSCSLVPQPLRPGPGGPTRLHQEAQSGSPSSPAMATGKEGPLMDVCGEGDRGGLQTPHSPQGSTRPDHRTTTATNVQENPCLAWHSRYTARLLKAAAGHVH